MSALWVLLVDPARNDSAGAVEDIARAIVGGDLVVREANAGDGWQDDLGAHDG